MFAVAQTSTTDEGVEINGLIWATRNVDAPGTFAEKPEDPGMFYQWNSKIGWSSSGTAVSTDGSSWNSSWNGNGAETWGTANNICPVGWHVPTYDEFISLAQANQVSITENGQIGRKFTDKTSGSSVFFPIVGYRCWEFTSVVGKGSQSYYWTTTTYDNPNAGLTAYRAQISNTAVFSVPLPGLFATGFNVRCVKNKDINASVNNISSEKGKTIIGYYNILGQKLPEEPASELYIILYNNGTSEKIIIK